MERRKIQWREPAQAAQTEQLLASHYSRLLGWAAVLTRGDRGKAEEIVQEFCLYATLTKPDLSGVANLDGYLYTCLRHIYRSGLARSSREALHVVSIAEFDSFEFALAANRSGDPLQMQNDLRHICGYAVWRKESSKSASYFILHFFHGYGRREIAELACLPISAIYNKLKIARAEVKSYLEEPGKLRVVSRDRPPEPPLSWSLLSSGEVFNELRTTILQARTSDCLSGEELLAHYRSSNSKPISCSLLAHIVSCERCLATVDRHFRRPTLKDREPLDGFGSGPDSSSGSVAGPGGMTYKAMSQSVRNRWGKVHEHRPRTLSIAVNGTIIAFYDVQAEHNKLSAQIEHLEKARFVEVFSEQDVRLALLPIGELPPDGPHVQTQRVSLSDSRWLQLSLTFDGLGLHSEVVYFDPALAIETAEEDTEESPLALGSKGNTPIEESGFLLRLSEAYAAFTRTLRAWAPSSAIAWALTLAILFSAAGYFAYRRQNAPMNAQEILNESVKMETANLQGQTEHQVVRIEEVSANGQVMQQGIVDLWKDGDGGRYIRRLFDSRHRMIAAEWRNKKGEHGSRRNPAGKNAFGEDRSLLRSEFWDQDLSAQAFSKLGNKQPQVHAVFDGGYELTTVGPTASRPQLISATLVLDRRFLPVREIMRVRADGEIYELHFVQEEYERRPSASVPDATFELDGERLRSSVIPQHGFPNTAGRDVQLAELQIAVLYRLNDLGADTGEPIEVLRTPDGHIRISGTVADDALKRKIVSQLQTLAGHKFLDLRLISPRDLPARIPAVKQTFPQGVNVYDINQTKSAADATLRRYFQAKGLSGERLNSAVVQFSHDALQHAQLALQNAYALDRLGSALSTAELQSVSISSQQQWTEMVHKHASELESQLRALRGQMAQLLPSGAKSLNGGGDAPHIEYPAQFEQAANQLLRQAQDLNRDVGSVFTSNASANTMGEKQSGQDALLKATVNAIPLRQAEEIADFATQLDTSGSSTDITRQSSGDGTKTSGRPR